MLPEEINNKYTEFYNSTANNNVLDEKTTVLIQLAASMSIGCYP